MNCKFRKDWDTYEQVHDIQINGELPSQQFTSAAVTIHVLNPGGLTGRLRTGSPHLKTAARTRETVVESRSLAHLYKLRQRE